MCIDSEILFRFKKTWGLPLFWFFVLVSLFYNTIKLIYMTIERVKKIFVLSN